MKISADEFRSRLFRSLSDTAVLAGALFFAVTAGALIAVPLWALATSQPELYSAVCFWGLFSVSLTLWIRKLILLKKKGNLPIRKKLILTFCRTLSFLGGIGFLLSVLWRLPIPAVLSVAIILIFRLPLFLSRDSI